MRMFTALIPKIFMLRKIRENSRAVID